MAKVTGTSADATIPAVKGTNTGQNKVAFGGPPVGVEGESNADVGASAAGISGVGVWGHSINSQGIGVKGSAKLIGVFGEAVADPLVPAGGTGVQGVASVGVGVLGQSKTGTGVGGQSDSSVGVFGSCSGGESGVLGTSDTGHGVHGESRTNHAVHGQSAAGRGVVGISQTFVGVTGQSDSNDGVLGFITPGGSGIGVHGVGGRLAGFFEGNVQVTGAIAGQASTDAGVTGLHGDPQLQEIPTIESNHAGVFGASAEGAGVMGYSRNTASFGVIAFGGILASAVNHPLAGQFEGSVLVNGDVQVKGDISFPGADLAEQFNIAGSEVIEPGSVVVIDHEDGLRTSQKAYDTKVAGVVSGAGKYRPGIVLDKQHAQDNRLLVALGGKVYCRADAEYGAIEIGDLLTSSPTPGCAMKASDPKRAFGAVLGKALRPLTEGQGLIPILIALQ